MNDEDQANCTAMAIRLVPNPTQLRRPIPPALQKSKIPNGLRKEQGSRGLLPCSRVLHCSGTASLSSPCYLFGAFCFFILPPSRPPRGGPGEHKSLQSPRGKMKPIGCDRLGRPRRLMPPVQ